MFQKLGVKMKKKIKRISIISGAYMYLQYLCKYSAKFQIPALKIVRLRGVDFKKLVGFMVLNATFKQYFSYINLWRSVLLVQETGVPGEKSLTCRKSLTNLINILLY
jgi:hypothetical protein